MSGGGGARRRLQVAFKQIRRPPVDTKVAQSTHCGTPLTRIVLHRDHHPQLQRQGSQGMLPPILGRPSCESCSRESSTYGTNGQLRMAPPCPFRHMPHTGRAPQGAPPAASAPCARLIVCLSTGLGLIPPPCLGCGSEASGCVPVGVSWHASRAPLRASSEASGGLWGAVWEPLGVSFGPLGGLLAVKGVHLGWRARKVNWSSPSWASLGAI